MRKNNSGFSLVELLVAMVIFSILMLLTSAAFKTILFQSSMLFKSAESNIEGVVGLEMLRKDLAQAGYGLPWSVQKPYSSASVMPITTPVFVSYTSLNDATLRAPRAIGSLDNVGYNGSDYLAIKSTVVAMNDTAKKNGILRQTTGLIQTESDPLLKFSGTDTVTVINPIFSPTGLITNKVLIGRDLYTNVSSATSVYRPTNPNDSYLVYGLDANNMRAPFNRADYFVYRPTDVTDVPDVCAKVANNATKAVSGIGTLYKAVMSQVNGKYTMYPLLDCVVDMQVVYGVDETPTQDGSINMHYDVLRKPYYDAATIRSNLKEVRVYILAQDGKKDSSYFYPNSTILVGTTVGTIKYGRTFDFSASNIKDWRNYRWKLYTVIVRTNAL